MNTKSTIRLTESDLHRMIRESVKQVLKEYESDNDYYRELKEMHKQLSDFLNKRGVKSAKLSEFRSGLPNVSLTTDEYFDKDVAQLCDIFCKGRKMYISSDNYPATTYLRINQL